MNRCLDERVGMSANRPVGGWTGRLSAASQSESIKKKRWVDFRVGLWAQRPVGEWIGV